MELNSDMQHTTLSTLLRNQQLLNLSDDVMNTYYNPVLLHEN